MTGAQRGRPPLPAHRKLARIQHGTATGHRYHKKDPELYGPICDACRKAWNEYMADYRHRLSRQRIALKSLLEQAVTRAIERKDPGMRSLTTKELDVAIRMLRWLDFHIDEKTGQQDED